MEDEPARKPLDYAGPEVFPKRNTRWIWIGIALLGIVLVLLFMGSRYRGYANLNSDSSRACLRQIGQAIQLYANDFQGQYPDTFSDLLAEDITPDIFISRSSNDTPATGPTTQAIAASLATPGHCSYIYLGKALTRQTAQPTMVIAYEPAAINGGQGGNVLFGDGHVEFVKMPAMNSILNQIKAGTWPVHFPLLPATSPSPRP